MPRINAERARKEMRNGAGNITEEDVKVVLEKRDEIEKKFKGNGPLKRFVEDVKLLFALVEDYWDGVYREVPWWTVAAIVFALLYVLSPIDLIPDFIPIIGYTDDALVVAACLAMVHEDLQNYKEWIKHQI